uniref:CSON013711 protein n=1 Tax=Culicoides sonorensis TaxID=179676 RepID=A0A336M9A4_CULSO
MESESINEKIELEDICRLCAKKKNEFKFDVLLKNYHFLLEKVKEFLNIQIQEGDRCRVICIECKEKLDHFSQFYIEVQQAQKYFEDEVLKESTSNIEIKVEEDDLENSSKAYEIKEELPSKIEGIIAEDVVESDHGDSHDNFESDASSSNHSSDVDDEEDDENHEIHGTAVQKAQSEKINKFYKFKCSPCKSDLKTFMMYQIHMRKVHKNETPSITCCNISIQCQRGKLLEHYLIHTTPEELQCKYCCKQYYNKRAKRRHEKTHLAKQRKSQRLPCPKCDRTLSDKASLKSHIKNLHTPDSMKQKYQCDLCKKELTTKFSVLNHLIVKHKMEVDCQPSNFDEILCPFCAKSFRNRSTFNYHYQVKHEITMTVCPECGVEMNKKALRSHIRRIHDRQSQTCPVCLKQFRNMHALNLHKGRVHVDAKHKCDICGKMFKMKDKLNDHRKGHFIENRFQCDMCNVANNDYANILKHRKQVHPNATPIPHGMGKKLLEIGYQQVMTN